MNQTELVQQIRAFLADKDDVTAPGLELLSKAMAALERDAPASAPMAATLPGWARIAETFMYDALAELGLLPEREDEPAPNLQLALQADPTLPDVALSTIALAGQTTYPPDNVRFITAVRAMLEAGDNEALEQVYGRLEAKAQYLANLEAGIAERDGKLASAEAILSKCLEALGMGWDEIDLLPYRIGRYVEYSDNKRDAMVENTLAGRSSAEDVNVVDPAVHLVHQRWIDDAVDLAHAVAGNLAPENRVMAKAAKHLIKTAPREA